MANVTVTARDAAGHTATATATYATSTPPTGGGVHPFHRVGISSARDDGLNSSETLKRQRTMERHTEMAQQLGITPAAMRAASGRHVYDTSSTPDNNVMDIGVFRNCVEDGYGTIMLTTSRWNDMAGVGGGQHDNTIKACLASMSATGRKIVWNVKHEPSNNGWGATDEGHWRKIQARLAWLVWQHDDPNIHYSDCHIPMAADEARWNWMPELRALRPNDHAAINARTYLGLDPYPEVGVSGSGHTLQTLQSKCGAAINAQRAWGRTGPLCLNEVAFFNWCIGHSEPYTLTAAQQAQRMHDQLWTWGQANDLRAYFYYDVASLNDSDVRDSSRTLDSAPELLEYAKLARGDYY